MTKTALFSSKEIQNCPYFCALDSYVAQSMSPKLLKESRFTVNRLTLENVILAICSMKYC